MLSEDSSNEPQEARFGLEVQDDEWIVTNIYAGVGNKIWDYKGNFVFTRKLLNTSIICAKYW